MARLFIQELIDQAVEKVVQKRGTGGFFKSDVVGELRKNKPLHDALKNVHDLYNGQWQLGDLLVRQINTMIGDALSVRDENKIRKYESYSIPGKRERRFVPLRAMTKGMLLNVMRETRTQKRQLELKGENYELFLDALDKLGPEATIGEVYDEVAPKIVEHRRAG